MKPIENKALKRICRKGFTIPELKGITSEIQKREIEEIKTKQDKKNLWTKILSYM